MMVIDNKFYYGQIVYLKTDPEQLPHMITAFVVIGDMVQYQLSCGTYETVHSDIEISETKDYLITVDGN